MKVVIVDPDKQPYVKEIRNELKPMKSIVKGYLETIPLIIENKQFIGVCNEEGSFTEKPNRVFNGMILYGPFFIAGFDGLSEFEGLSDEDLALVLSYFN